MLSDVCTSSSARHEMALTTRRIARPKRGPGERANITIEKIAAAAFDVLEKSGLDDFSARLVAKKLGVTPAAVYGHFDGGFAGLKRHLVISALLTISRPYGPTDTPAGYLRDLFVRTLQEVRRKQGLAHLIALELSRDQLVSPIFLERLFSAALGIGKPPPNKARVLDLALGALLGMIMVEGEIPSDQILSKTNRNFLARIKAQPANDVPTLLATSTELAIQVAARLVPKSDLAAKSALRYAEPLIATLEAGKA